MNDECVGEERYVIRKNIKEKMGRRVLSGEGREYSIYGVKKGGNESFLIILFEGIYFFK